MRKLAIITTHPIQYYAPVFRILSENLDGNIHVFYTAGREKDSYDAGFQKEIEWDIPLLTGYQYTFLENTSSKPGLGHYQGIRTPDAIKQINEYGPHAILIYGWSYHSHLSIMRHFSGKIPVWFRGDSNLLDHNNSLKAFIRNTWLRRVYKHVDIAFYVGSANREYFLKAGLKEDKLRFAPHAIDNNRFSQPRCKEALEFRRKYDIPETASLILFAGKFEKKKDPLLLLEAFSKLEDPSLYLLFTGNGDLENLMKEKASAGSDRIRFADFQNQAYMPVVYQSCNLFCLPSQGPGETWGLSVNEAMAAGRAVVVSDKVGCAMDLIRDNVNGAVFPSGDLHALSNKLRELMSGKQRLQQMGSASKEIIDNWTFKIQAGVIESEIKKL